MFRPTRPPRRCALRPSLDTLEGRALLSTMMPQHHGHAEVARARPDHHGPQPNNMPSATLLGTAGAGGYLFTNFDGPNPGNIAGAGTNANGISNAGTSVGFVIDNNGNFSNFTVNPLKPHTLQHLNIEGSMNANAFGVNRFGEVVGTDGNGKAFTLSNGRLSTFIPLGGSAATAFGVNDLGQVVGQYTDAAGEMPGFVRINNKTFLRIDAPSGPDTVNAQGINNRGQVVGFYVGTDGQDHGFMTNVSHLRRGTTRLTGAAIADPTIPNVPGEPGATFVFSQILAVNDNGIAVGYYGDSTTSQHGFIYNTHTGQYKFLDDPSEAFDNGVEVTQITGITDSGEITGFYSDANGVFHAFVANPQMP